MRKIHPFLILIFVFSAIFIIIAKAEDRGEAPPGMELIKSGKLRYLVPMGTKISRGSGVVTYAAVENIVIRLSDVEERLSAIEKEIEQLKSVGSEMQKE